MQYCTCMHLLWDNKSIWKACSDSIFSLLVLNSLPQEQEEFKVSQWTRQRTITELTGENGQVKAWRNDCDIDCVDESILFDGDKTDLEVSRDHTGLEGNSRRRRNKKAITNGTRLHLSKQNYFWLLKESQFVTSLRQDSTPGLKHVPCLECISEQDEVRSNDGREGLNEKVKLPSIVTCQVSLLTRTKLNQEKARSMAAEISLPPLTRKRLPAKR